MSFLISRISFVIFILSLIAGCSQEPPPTAPSAKKSSNNKKKPPDFERMPLRLGSWEGKELPKLDPEIFARIKANAIVDRMFKNPEGEIVMVHLAVYSDWDEGFRHNPMVPYKDCGWKLDIQFQDTLKIRGGKTIRVKLSTWERDEDQSLLLYWYQLGDRVLFKKSDLNQIQLEKINKKTRPHLIKVQLQSTLSNTGKTIDAIIDLAREIGKWLDEPYYD